MSGKYMADRFGTLEVSLGMLKTMQGRKKWLLLAYDSSDKDGVGYVIVTTPRGAIRTWTTKAEAIKYAESNYILRDRGVRVLGGSTY